MVLGLPGSSLLYHGLHGSTILVLMVTAALVNDQCQNLTPYRIDTLNRSPNMYHMYVCILRAKVQPTLEPYAEAFFCSRPIALTQDGRSLVNDVCECVRD